MDIGGWLRGLGLERYEAAFRDNDVDAGVLPELTAEDLIGLGVVSIGHRRKLLAAIAGLRGGNDAGSDAPATLRQPERLTISAGAERRQLTVMFCDLVGSTALSARLDPEDLREVIGTYHRSIAETVAPFAGFVAKYMGDGALVYFGYPRAHEHDAERAVRAALALIAAASQVDVTGERLQLRVGIATGIAVVGDLIGSGAAQEEAVIGDTPNLAARLQALASPNTCIIADSTRRLVGALFEYEDIGRIAVKGFSAPMQA
jgi:class 3 adenylate cyclase